jgi:hypothetical protein
MGPFQKALQKAGGPYIGPKGGKWADPEHKVPWTGYTRGPQREKRVVRTARGLEAVKLRAKMVVAKLRGKLSFNKVGAGEHHATHEHPKARTVSTYKVRHGKDGKHDAYAVHKTVGKRPKVQDLGTHATREQAQSALEEHHAKKYDEKQ